WERAAKWAKRRPAAAALIAVSVTALVLLFVVGLVFNAQVQHARQDVAAKVEEVDEQREAVKRATAEAEQERAQAREANRQAEQGPRVGGEGRAADGAGHWGESLVLCTEALRRDPNDPVRSEGHRMRIGSLLRRFPRLVHEFALGASCNVAMFSPDGKRVLTA